MDRGRDRPCGRPIIDLARADGIVNDYTYDIIHTGRQLINRHIHAMEQQVWPPLLAANVIGASHMLVAELFDEGHLRIRESRGTLNE
jgi:hypothetical protein